jgi:hypothetical protein
MVSAATTLHSGPNPSLAAATTPFTPSATGPPFSYGMPSSSTSPVLTYSILQTLGLGVGISNAPLQGHLGGTPVPFNTFPYAGGHSLLRPLRLVVCISSPPRSLHTLVYLEQGVKEHLLIVCR